MPRPANASQLRDALVRGVAVPDEAVDALYPDDLRERSAIHWTPVAIAQRAAQLLDVAPGTEVLDIGAGVGKACIVAQLATGIRWWGVERDAIQIEAAHHAAWQLGIRDDVRFVHGEAWSIEWARFGALYFFNPFPLPEDAPPRNAFKRYSVFVSACLQAEEQLATLRPGTRIVTYHGFGGDFPDGWERVAREEAHTDALELWVRR
jgi:SAM-dependent methyltransferase